MNDLTDAVRSNDLESIFRDAGLTAPQWVLIRAVNTLRFHGVENLAQLAGYSRKQLLRMSRIGKALADCYQKVLEAYDLSLRREERR